jgi:antirestriction protein ArdC
MAEANHESALEALERATTGQALTNYPAIFEGFMAKGIAEADIKPRENVFTFQAWKALGRSVKRGEHGVRVVTFIECSGRERDPSTGEERPTSYRRPHTTTVFHISQTEPTSEREARKPQRAPQIPALAGMSPMGFKEREREEISDGLDRLLHHACSRWVSCHLARTGSG